MGNLYPLAKGYCHHVCVHMSVCDAVFTFNLQVRQMTKHGVKCNARFMLSFRQYHHECACMPMRQILVNVCVCLSQKLSEYMPTLPITFISRIQNAVNVKKNDLYHVVAILNLSFVYCIINRSSRPCLSDMFNIWEMSLTCLTYG